MSAPPGVTSLFDNGADLTTASRRRRPSTRSSPPPRPDARQVRLETRPLRPEVHPIARRDTGNVCLALRYPVKVGPTSPRSATGPAEAAGVDSDRNLPVDHGATREPTGYGRVAEHEWLSRVTRSRTSGLAAQPADGGGHRVFRRFAAGAILPLLRKALAGFQSLYWTFPPISA